MIAYMEFKMSPELKPVYHLVAEYELKSPESKKLVDNIRTMLEGKVLAFGEAKNYCLLASKEIALAKFKNPQNGINFGGGVALGITNATKKTCSFSLGNLSFAMVQNYAKAVIQANEIMSNAIKPLGTIAAVEVEYEVED